MIPSKHGLLKEFVGTLPDVNNSCVLKDASRFIKREKSLENIVIGSSTKTNKMHSKSTALLP